MSDRVRPFSCGTQLLDWDARNCDRCLKVDYDARVSNCQWYDELQLGLFGDGTISAEAAVAIGYPGIDAYTWDCPERQTELPPVDVQLRRAGASMLPGME